MVVEAGSVSFRKALVESLDVFVAGKKITFTIFNSFVYLLNTVDTRDFKTLFYRLKRSSVVV